MKGDRIKYRADGRKYQLAEGYAVKIGVLQALRIGHGYFSLDPTGWLMVRRGYAWDGPSGPACDTPSAMRGSLVHDVLYQALRLGLLASAWREVADREYRRLCLEDGMWRLRAAYHFAALRWFGRPSTEPEAEPPVLEAP